MSGSKTALLDRLYRIIYFIEVGWLLIDAIGGYFLHANAGDSIFNTLIRGVVLIFILTLFILDKNIKGRTIPFIIIFCYFILSFIQYAVFKLETIDTSIIFRLILLPVFLILFRAQLEQGRISTKNMNTILSLNIFILVFNISLSFFNIGFSNYGINKEGSFVGGTGFFYAGNEVGGAIAVLSALGFFFFSRKGLSYTIIFAIIFLICSLGLLSKTALASVALNISLMIFLSGVSRSVLTGFLILAAVLIFQQNILNQIGLFMNRASYFADQYGWQTVLLGGYKRQDAISILSGLLFNYPIIYLIGHGWNGYTENNFFDLLEAFGLIGYVFFIIPFFFFYFSVRNASFREDRKYYMLVFNCILVFLIAVFAGHMIQSAMNSLFIAILLNFGNFRYITGTSTEEKEAYD